MKAIGIDHLDQVSGGMVQLPNYDDIIGSSRPTDAYAFEVGQTGMGDNYSYTGSGASGYSASSCSLIGSLTGLAVGLTVGGTCGAAALLVTGGTAVPACSILGTVSGIAAGATASNYCNTQSGR